MLCTVANVNKYSFKLWYVYIQHNKLKDGNFYFYFFKCVFNIFLIVLIVDSVVCFPQSQERRELRVSTALSIYSTVFFLTSYNT